MAHRSPVVSSVSPGTRSHDRMPPWSFPWAMLAWPGSPLSRWLIGAAGFAAGLVACVLLTIIEYGAWALVLPPRSKQGVESEPTADAEAISAMAADGAALAGRWYPAIEHHGPGRIA